MRKVAKSHWRKIKVKGRGIKRIRVKRGNPNKRSKKLFQ